MTTRGGCPMMTRLMASPGRESLTIWAATSLAWSNRLVPAVA